MPDTPSNFIKTITANAERLSKLVVTDTKLLPEISKQLAAKRASYESEATALYNLEAVENKSLPPTIEKTELDKRVTEMLQADKQKIAASFQQVGKGESKNLDMNDMLGIVAVGSGFSAAVQSGSIGAILVSFVSMLKNSWIGEKISAGLMMLSGDKDGTKPKSFGEAVERIKFNKGVAAFAQQTGLSEETLRKELLKPIDPPANDNTQPVSHPEAGPGMVVPAPAATPAGGPAPAKGQGKN